jgi:hypothetical protein
MPISWRELESIRHMTTISAFTQGNEFLTLELTAICGQSFGRVDARKLMPAQRNGSYLRWTAIQVAKKIIMRWESDPPVACG